MQLYAVCGNVGQHWHKIALTGTLLDATHAIKQ